MSPVCEQRFLPGVCLQAPLCNCLVSAGPSLPLCLGLILLWHSYLGICLLMGKDLPEPSGTESIIPSTAGGIKLQRPTWISSSSSALSA